MFKKILIGAFLLLTVIAMGAVVYFVMMLNMVDSRVNESYVSLERGQSTLREEDAENLTNSFTVLILGVDQLAEEDEAEDELFPDAEYHRSDTMILAMFNKDEDEVQLVGIPRDTITYIDEVGYFDKINHAHMFGGPDAAVDTVESLFNVPVDYYVTVNMNAVVDVVDALGGVEFDVPFDMNEPNSSNNGRVILEEGTQTLDGEGALAVVRSRRVDSDLARNNRQIEMVFKILEEAKSTEALLNLDEFIDVVADNISHNIPADEMRGLATYYAFNNLTFKSVQLRGEDYWTEGKRAYFYRPNEEHLYLISNTIREELGLRDGTEPNDLINIRLRNYLEPYTVYDNNLLYNHFPEEEPYFMSYYYVSTLGDGINIPEFEPEKHNVEGEDDLEDLEELDDEDAESDDGDLDDQEEFDNADERNVLSVE